MIVMAYFEHDDFKAYYDKLTWPQVTSHPSERLLE